MKRLLILFILIASVVVSCGGPNKVGRWTKPDFSQDKIEKDRKECIQSIDQNLDSEVFGIALEECLAGKGYTYQTPQDAQETKEEPTTKDKIITVGKAVGKVLLGVVVVALYLGLMALPK